MLGWLIGLINPLTRISEKLVAAYAEKQNAQTEQQRIAAEERIHTLEAQKAVILQGQSDPFERWVRIGFAAPFVVYNAKLLVWDKILGWGVTDGLGPELATIQSIVIGGYFLTSIAKRFSR